MEKMKNVFCLAIAVCFVSGVILTGCAQPKQGVVDDSQFAKMIEKKKQSQNNSY